MNRYVDAMARACWDQRVKTPAWSEIAEHLRASHREPGSIAYIALAALIAELRANPAAVEAMQVVGLNPDAKAHLAALCDYLAGDA